MSSFTFQRLQCLQSFTLSKDYNVFIYISITSLSSVIYAFKRLQCLHLHFKDFYVFRLLHFIRLQSLWSLSLSLCFIGLDDLCFYAFFKKIKNSSKVLCSIGLQCPFVYRFFLPWFSLVSWSNSKIT